MSWNREGERKAARAMGIGESLFAVTFSIVWCCMAAAMGAWFMLLFGVPFVGLSIFRLIACIRLTRQDSAQTKKPPVTCATGDPWEQPHSGPITYCPPAGDARHCPYCAGDIRPQFTYCPSCGRKIH